MNKFFLIALMAALGFPMMQARQSSPTKTVPSPSSRLAVGTLKSPSIPMPTVMI